MEYPYRQGRQYATNCVCKFTFADARTHIYTSASRGLLALFDVGRLRSALFVLMDVRMDVYRSALFDAVGGCDREIDDMPAEVLCLGAPGR